MWLMLQQEEPDDYVIATGEMHSVREFVELAFRHINRTIQWKGKGTDEKGYDAQTGQMLIVINPKYFRPTDVVRYRGLPYSLGLDFTFFCISHIAILSFSSYRMYCWVILPKLETNSDGNRPLYFR